MITMLTDKKGKMLHADILYLCKRISAAIPISPIKL
jgi:hypothetical protein